MKLKPPTRTTIAVGLGFMAGVVAGFMFGQGVKKNAPNNIKTGVKDGIVYVHFDASKTISEVLF